MKKTAGTNKVKKRPLPEIIILAFASIITAVPLYYVFINAFKKPEFIQLEPYFMRPEQFTFNNIARAFTAMKYPEAFFNNLLLLVISSVLMILIGSMAGFAIAIVKSKLLNAYYIVSVLVITVPFQIVMVPLIMIMKKTFLINNYIGVSLVYVAVSLPMVIFLYTGFMRSLPRELSEAAIVDGCNLMKSYYYVYMPLMKTVTGTVLIIKGTFIWNDFLIPLITISKSSMTPLTLRLYGFASVRYNSWDLIFGGTLLCSIPVVILFLSLQKYFIRGVVAGAVKG